jgi:hypothetical protein
MQWKYSVDTRIFFQEIRNLIEDSCVAVSTATAFVGRQCFETHSKIGYIV